MMRQYELVDRVRRYNPEDRRGHAQPRLRLRDAGAWRAGPRLRRPLLSRIRSRSRRSSPISTSTTATIVAAVLHDVIEDTAVDARGDRSAVRSRDRNAGRRPDQAESVSISFRSARCRPRTSASCCSPSPPTCACCWSSSPTGCTTCARFTSWPPDKRARIAEETLDIYAPLAGRMGMQRMREELEDLAFRHLMPDAHATIEARLVDVGRDNKLRDRRHRVGDRRRALAAEGIEADVKGRQKQPYSVWRKMERKQITFEQMSDIFGFRIIVGDLAGVLPRRRRGPHALADGAGPLQGLHFDALSPTTTARSTRRWSGPGRQRVELQIRTAAMHDIASNGIAAHALYKEGMTLRRERAQDGEQAPSPGCAAPSSFWRTAPPRRSSSSTPSSNCSSTRCSASRRRAGSSRCRAAPPRSISPMPCTPTSATRRGFGAKINGRGRRRCSPSCGNGDEVEIVRQEGQVPPAVWESLVVTGKARAAIRRATREAMRAQYAGLGRQIVARAFERAGRVLVRRAAQGGAAALRPRQRRGRARRRRARRDVLRRRAQGGASGGR